MIIAVNDKGRQIAKLLAEALDDKIGTISDIPYLFSAHSEESEKGFIIFIGAMGICVRSIAPYIKDKHTDPAVVCIDSLGQNVISVLSGHVGGANELTSCIAKVLHANPVITTQSDLQGLWALDTLCQKYDWEILRSTMNMEIAAFVAGKPTALYIDIIDEGTKYLLSTLPEHVTLVNDISEITMERYDLAIIVSPYEYPTVAGVMYLHYIPHCLHAGIGLAHNAGPTETVIDEIFETFRKNRIIWESIADFNTIDLKADEPVVKALQARDFKFNFYTAEQLSAVDVPNPSETVSKHVGTPSVSEAAALKAPSPNPSPLILRGEESRILLLPKVKGTNWTLAVAADSCKRTLIDDADSCKRALIDDADSCKQTLIDDADSCKQTLIDDADSCKQTLIDDVESCKQTLTDDADFCKQTLIDDADSCKQTLIDDTDSCKRTLVSKTPFPPTKEGERVGERGFIEIVGAGPGDPELISVRGKRFLEQADLILYAGSLVPKELTYYAKPDCVVRSSADMNLEEQFALMKEFYDKGKLVVRLHTGDPCIYGAIQEQMAFFDKYHMDYHITPGISSFLAAAAELRSQFTIPERCQTIILTRGEGRTPMPDKEKLHMLAAHQSTMCIFLSASIVEQVQEELLAGGYPPETPVAACYKLTWKDQRIYRGQLKDLAKILHDNHLTLTTMIVVGDAIDNRQGLSKLYDHQFTHLFRQAK